MKRSRELKPLSSEHHQALLVAFQMKKALEGHPEAAGAPRDLPGLVSLARRFEGQVFAPHAAAEEALLGAHLAGPDRARLAAEHVELKGLVEHARTAAPGEQRVGAGGLRRPAGAPRPLGGARALPLRRGPPRRRRAGGHRRRAGAAAGAGRPGAERRAPVAGQAAGGSPAVPCQSMRRVTYMTAASAAKSPTLPISSE